MRRGRDIAAGVLATLNLAVAILNLLAFAAGGSAADLVATIAWIASSLYWLVRV